MIVSEQLLQQFRVVALERLEKIEAAWGQILVAISDGAIATLHREVHTLKGESRVLGFTDINLVTHKLEDMLEVARARGYAVDEDFDLTVNMAVRFMVMLVRKRVGAQLGGIDLPGFIRQMDQVLADVRADPTSRGRAGTAGAHARLAAPVRIPTVLRDRLAAIAVDVWIEYAAARDVRRNRLRASWYALRELIGLARAIVGTAQLVKHKAGALALARELGKQITVAFEPETAEVTTEVLAAIDVATLHLVRNAIDHGIEARSVREAAGKPPAGLIRIRGGLRDGRYTLSVADDGCGIPFERVRARAIELGMVPRDGADQLDPDRLVELMCLPGFSTRTEANEVSGRGIGLDAVRAAVVELGGTLTAGSTGAGTTWTIAIPVPSLTIHAHVVRAANVPFPLVIDGTWTVDLGPSAAEQLSPPPSPPPSPVDIASVLGLATGNPTSSGTPVWFSRGDHQVAILCERLPAPAQVRRLVPTPPSSLGEIVAIESTEALLIRLERL